MKKRMLALLLTLCMLVSLLPAQIVFAENSEEVPAATAEQVVEAETELVSEDSIEEEIAEPVEKVIQAETEAVCVEPCAAAANNAAIVFQEGESFHGYVGDTQLFTVVSTVTGGSVGELDWSITEDSDLCIDTGYTEETLPENSTLIYFVRVGTATLVATDLETGNTCTITITVEGKEVEPDVGDTGATPVYSGMNSVTIPANSTITCAFAPYATGGYGTWQFFAEGKELDWWLDSEKIGVNNNPYEYVDGQGFGVWLYSGGETYLFDLVNNSNEDITLPLQIYPQAELEGLRAESLEGTLHAGESRDLKAIPVNGAAGGQNFIDWACEGPATLVMDAYAETKVYFYDAGTVTLTAFCNKEDDYGNVIETIQDTFTVTVAESVGDNSVPGVTGIAFPEDTYVGEPWDWIPCEAELFPAGVSADVVYGVSDTSVARMEYESWFDTGHLWFYDPGTTVMTAICGDLVAHCNIIVEDPYQEDDTPNATVIAFNLGQEATYIITDDGYVGEPTDGAGFHIPDGSSLKAEGYTISEPVFWEPSREFLGWRAYTLEPVYEEGQFMYYDYVQIPGTGFMNTAQMLEYTIPADTNVYFMGEWAGDDSDYYSSVAFDGFGGEFDIYFGNEYYSTTDMDNFGYNREGRVIGDECSRYFDGAFDIMNIRSERGDFRGWIQYTGSNENGWTMVEREDNLITWEALELLVPEEDTVFVACWEGVSWDEYLNYGKDHGGGEGDFAFPEDATYTELFLDQKAPLLGEQENYYTFIAPADGYYSLCYDSFETGLDIWDNQNVYYWVIPETGKIVVYLEAGQEYVFRAVAALDCQIWIEKALAITKLEILEFDASKTVMKTNEWMGAYLLDGMTVKATFEDGTTKTVTMPNEVGEYTLDGYEPMLQYDFENTTGTTGVVTLYYGDASDTFTVKLLEKKVTNVEVVPGTLEVTEYTQGWLNENEDGFVFKYHFPRILEAKGTLRFTWSDNTTETLAYDANNPYFYGLYLGWEYAEENWTAGNTYDVSIYYGGIESSVAVKILESSVEKLEIINDITAALCEPEFAQNPDGSWCLDDVDLNEMEFKVTFKDQTSKTYKFSDLREDRYDYYAGDYPINLAPQDYALLDNITGPCEIPLVLFVGGKSAELSIHVVEKLVEDNQTTVGSPAIDEALKNETDGEIVVDGTSSEQGDANVPAVNLPATSLDKVADAGVDMTIKMDNAQVTFDQKAVESIAQQAGEAEAAQVQLSVEAVPMDQLTDKQRHKIESVMKNSDETPLVLDITLSVGEETISNFHGGNATIRVPFTPAEGTDGEDYAVWYIPEDGKQVQQMKTTYEDGYLIFTTNHFSDYVAMKEDLSVGDDADDLVPGDMDGDGNTTNKDVIALLWHTLFPESNPIVGDGDINGDGVITNSDVIALLWYVLFPEIYPL